LQDLSLICAALQIILVLLFTEKVNQSYHKNTVVQFIQSKGISQLITNAHLRRGQ